MELRELKQEAKKAGFYLLKAQPREKLLPCTCGCKKRRTLYSPKGVVLECTKCGRHTRYAKNPTDARAFWNAGIRAEMKYGDKQG